MSERVDKSDADWQAELTPEQYYVTRQKGTEAAFTGRYWNEKRAGVYRCVCCGERLFESNAKYESGTGWPSFFCAISDDVIENEIDNSLFMSRTEIHCKRCGAHLGHVFPDGPRPTGLRFCVNSAALDFQPTNDEAAE